MIFPGKSAPPVVSHWAFYDPVIDQACGGNLTVITTPPGYLLAESLALTLHRHGLPILWLRTGTEDRDPGRFLLSLINSSRRIDPNFGSSTLEEIRQRPGPIFGWPPIFSLLGREMARDLPENTAIVLEHVHNLEGGQPSFQLLVNHLVPVLPPSFSMIFTSDHRLPDAAFPARTVFRGSRDLRLDQSSGLMLARESDTDLSWESIQRAVQLTEGRAVALVGLYSASHLLGSTIIQQALKSSKNFLDLFILIARAFFISAETGALQALSLVSRLEFFHPGLVQVALEGTKPLDGPWFLPLSDQWIQLRRIWHAPIHKALKSKIKPDPALLHSTAEYLVSQNALDDSIRLYLEAGDTARAAQVVIDSAENLLNSGQWATLKEWLNLIPQAALRKVPRLVFIRGELLAAEGQTQAARRDFSEAVNLFSAKQDSTGTCQSLLAETILAVWDNEPDYAQARCLSARALAESAGLYRLKGLAAWQLGSLSAVSGKLDEALVYFSQASADLEEPLFLDFFNNVKSLIIQQRESQKRRDRFFREFIIAQKCEQQALTNLQQLLGSPVENLETILKEWGWFNTPLAAKLPSPAYPYQEQEDSQDDSLPDTFWQKLFRLFMMRRKTAEPLDRSQLVSPLISDGADLDYEAQFTNSDPPDVQGPPPVTILTAENLHPGDIALFSVSSISPTIDFKTGRLSESGVKKKDPDWLAIEAHFFGTFRISVNDQPVQNWPGGRASSVAKYLVINHERRIPRDVLMDTFWPDSQPESARNSLNVTLHGLRRTFREATEVPVIIFDNGSYSLNAAWELWIDIDEFERHIRSSRLLEATGQLEAAMRELEIAASLYHGDFLEDEPYENWALLTRERTRLEYLDILDHLNHIYLDQEHYTECATLCHVILNRDCCREDAHRRLMRCYCRLGKRHLALRQFQLCVEALKNELDIDPEPSTLQLAKRIRNQEVV
jgi:DNA-binding SARP family transcriptional activator